ncbi:histone h2ax [Phtheirospermum japonicum]|uniref:Histone h2ax n=1 Tax=Phtheirospermum japonicum TaxID=374723 RepID=A0A830CSK2_9LAMI|nr:histone h2ax [Phtheirospermum japonicum]
MIKSIKIIKEIVIEKQQGRTPVSCWSYRPFPEGRQIRRACWHWSSGVSHHCFGIPGCRGTCFLNRYFHELHSEIGISRLSNLGFWKFDFDFLLELIVLDFIYFNTILFLP